MLANHASASNDSPQGDSEYEIILTALMETARGRSFLQEYAQRNRATDTATLLTAIGRIEGLLTSRSLEPAASRTADDAPRSNVAEPPERPDVEAADVEIMAADIVEIESNHPPEILAVEAFSIEVVEIDIVPVDVAESVAVPLDVAVPQANAIEFLGPECLGPECLGPECPGPECPEPDLTDTKPARDAPAPAAKRAPRDPFADIRALSDDEKIALFT